VSDHGRVRRVKDGQLVKAREPFNSKTQLVIGDIAVEKLVMRAFVGEPPSPEMRHVRHKNGDLSDNRLSNLEYGTWEELKKDKYRRRAAHLKASPNTLTEREWQICLDYFNHQCVYCGKHESECGVLQQDHFIPISHPDGPGHVAHNVVPACPSCNSSKSSMTYEVWRKFWARHTRHLTDEQLLVDPLLRFDAAAIALRKIRAYFAFIQQGADMQSNEKAEIDAMLQKLTDVEKKERDLRHQLTESRAAWLAANQETMDEQKRIQHEANELKGQIRQLAREVYEQTGESRPHRSIKVVIRKKPIFNEQTALEWALETGRDNLISLRRGAFRSAVRSGEVPEDVAHYEDDIEVHIRRRTAKDSGEENHS
jgi:5-methylcytosine-specific restriction endonuclease McrA